MRVLHLQRVSGIAGSENHLLRLLPGLAQRGVEVRFLTLEPQGAKQLNGSFYEALDRAGVPNDRVAFNRLPGPRSLGAAIRIVDRYRPDLVHSHLIHADLFAACLKYSGTTHARFVTTKHGYREAYQAKNGLDGTKIRLTPYSIAVRLSSGAMSGAVAVSRGLANLYVGGGLIAADRVAVIPHGMKPTAPSPRTPGLRLGDPQIVTVGRLIEVKGHRYVLESVARLAGRYPNLRLILVGSGPLRDRLARIAANLGISQKVVFTGFSTEVGAQLRTADLVVIPSVSEGFGLVFLEAFDAGVPVVAFDVPAGNEIVEHGKSGELVPFGDIGAMSSAIGRLLADPTERARLAAGGQLRLRTEFNLELMVSRTIAFYEQILAAEAVGREGMNVAKHESGSTRPGHPRVP